MRLSVLFVGLFAVACSSVRGPMVFLQPPAQGRVASQQGSEWDMGLPVEVRGANGRELSFLTYNVKMWNYREGRFRLPMVFSILRDSNADVIALQEASYWFVHLLRQQDWVQAGYQLAQVPGVAHIPGGLVILSRYPIKESHLRTLARAPYQRWRFALQSVIEFQGLEVAVTNVHLESILEAGPIRQQQLDQVRSMQLGFRHRVVLGDFNFGDGDAENTALGRDFADLWLKLRPQEPGYTWDMTKSWMARIYSFRGETSRRLDRILVQSRSLKARSITLVGDRPQPFWGGTIFASDHFGVRGSVVLGKEGPALLSALWPFSRQKSVFQ